MVFLSILTNVKLLCEKNGKKNLREQVTCLDSCEHASQLPDLSHFSLDMFLFIYAMTRDE